MNESDRWLLDVAEKEIARLQRRCEELEDPGCSMHGRTDLGHGVGGHCTVRNAPCSPACLRKSLHGRELEVEHLMAEKQRLQRRCDHLESLLQEWLDAPFFDSKEQGQCWVNEFELRVGKALGKVGAHKGSP